MKRVVLIGVLVALSGPLRADDFLHGQPRQVVDCSDEALRAYSRGAQRALSRENVADLGEALYRAEVCRSHGYVVVPARSETQ